MGLSMAERPSTSKGAAVIGSNVVAVQAALALARMGIEVKLITKSAALCWNSVATGDLPGSSPDRRYLWPLLLQAASHPGITLFTNAEVDEVKGEKGDFKIRLLQHPRYINKELCTACGRCADECSVKLTSWLGEKKLTYGAIHAPLLEGRTVPSAYLIDKNGAAPCRVACPLGINVQGFVSLLSKGKTDEALALINEASPLAGILGRVCTHPCEDNCHRAQVDSPVSIRALHRYAADTAPGGIKYRSISPGSLQKKIAIIGSGPAGLTAAWELTRRGYSPTVFESHGVIGGMLATGIPRFRLPREVREREIEAIRNLGVDIRTGITFGRDINYAYLKERGYQAVFLAIGTQRNNSLSIPGEEIDGVVDCMSLLLALNLKLDTFVGLNVAVIGGGNAAIDAARSALRSGAKEVTVFYRRTRDVMPANADEVAEAIKEGVKIEYNVVPVEILGEGGRVTAIHCQRTRSLEGTTAGEQNQVEMIPGTGFLVEADHVVVAIGQSPDASQLNMKGLAIEEDTGDICINPLTLETSIPGVFAGGDCITGPNNVVQAMADGLKAAESIDRYLQGRDLEAERRPEPSPIAEIDLNNIEISPYQRARVPVISPQDRIKTYEETTLGISAQAAQRESQRCLNCALCSQCLECTTACELGAVCHEDTARHLEIEAQAVLRFPSGDSEKSVPAGIQTVFSESSDTITDGLARAMAAALETAIELKQDKAPVLQAQDIEPPEEKLAKLPQAPVISAGGTRLGVFLCSCGGSISSVIDFSSVSRQLSSFPGVNFIHEIAQACTEAGAREIAEQVTELHLDRVVLAACRCCNLEQICYGCTDRRQMCRQYLYQMIPRETIIEFGNIREQCAWIHRDDPEGATHKALQIISAAVACAQITPYTAVEEMPVLPDIFILGGGLANATAARALASRGYRVEMVSRGWKDSLPELEAIIPPALAKFQEIDLTVKPWPDSLELHGSPGNYDVVLGYVSQPEHISAGAILVDMEEVDREKPDMLDTHAGNGLLGRIISRCKQTGSPLDISDAILREVTIGETSGIFVLSPGYAESDHDRVLRGLSTAARISAYIEQQNIAPRANAVSIDSERCRGCGDCADICSYLEMRPNRNGIPGAYIDENLCLGCGACIAVCPTGAITQPHQSDRQLIATLSTLLQTSHLHSEV
jgi:NADPH-dependent glutamate synthase beta subunit-like oxidoreductase/NAD-dependent dihydropyrimidine dehydrogenase PreA subunit